MSPEEAASPSDGVRSAWGGEDSGDRIFWICALFAVLLHGLVLLWPPPIRGGADLLPHLRLVQQMAAEPGLRNVYPPAYHALGGLVSPWLGLAAWPKLFGVLGALAWIFGFRFFQRAAGLPASSAALFALLPYGFALSWCLPKIEAAGCGLVFFGLGLLLRRRYLGTAIVLAATFSLHTASALMFGIAGGVIALVRLDLRALLSLAVGTLGVVPLLLAHGVAGCSLPEALLFNEADYLRATTSWSSLSLWPLILTLANPLVLVLAVIGAPRLWRSNRPLACACGVLFFLYLNELWLAPFETRTTLDLLRGLSTLAFPQAIAAGLGLERFPRATPWLLALCAAAALLTAAPWASGSPMQRSCHVRSIELAELRDLTLERCSFRWRGPAIRRGLRGAGR